MSTYKKIVLFGQQKVGQVNSFGSRLRNKLRSESRRFAVDRSGAVAMIFALITPVIFAIVGGAIDIGRWISARDATLRAMDAAVLAAGRSMQINNTTPTQALAVARKFFDKNKPSTLSNEDVTFNLSDNGTSVVAVSNSSIKTPFLSVTGVQDMQVNLRSKAILAANGNAGTNIEISMMLDTTGSMSGQKMVDLKTAAKDLVDIVVWPDQSKYTSRVALAPFAHHVNVGQYFRDMTGQNPYWSSLTCIHERERTQHLYTNNNANGSRRFIASRYWCDTSEIMPLSDNKVDLKQAIDRLPTTGATAGHLGIAWSWYMLSPSFNQYWDNKSEAAPFSDLDETNVVEVGDAEYEVPKLKKIAVLMTDGAFNWWRNGPSSFTQAQELCGELKDDGIEVYAVAFDVGTSGSAYDIMQQCATSPEHFYPATSGDALKQAFRDIGLKVASLRLAE